MILRARRILLLLHRLLLEARRATRARPSRPLKSPPRVQTNKLPGSKRRTTPRRTQHRNRRPRKRLLRADVERQIRMQRLRRRRLPHRLQRNRKLLRLVQRHSVDKDREATTPKASRKCYKKTLGSSRRQRLRRAKQREQQLHHRPLPAIHKPQHNRRTLLQPRRPNNSRNSSKHLHRQHQQRPIPARQKLTSNTRTQAKV